MVTNTESGTWWDDDDFQDRLVSMLVKDPRALRSCGGLLTPDDFRPLEGARFGRARFIVAERALEHFQKHREPLGSLVRADVLQYAARLGLGAGHLAQLKEYLRKVAAMEAAAGGSLIEKVVEFKGARLKEAALHELDELQASGQLTDEKWREVTQRALGASKGSLETVDYVAGLEARKERRRLDSMRARVPWTFIDPLDVLVRTVGPKQLGLVLAPYKRGKSNMLLWLAVALVLQGYNVLYVTLEDPRDVVEDRLDSIVTYVPLHELSNMPRTLTRKFSRFRALVRARLHIYDGTDEPVTVPQIERVVGAEADRGFVAHAVLTDYDDEIAPVRRYKERRFESDETYRLYRQMLSRGNLIGWLAAQTQRDTRHLKILSGDRVAEDISKIRKVTCCLGLGKGEWTDDSIYLWVAAHKCDRMDVGCEIVPDLARSVVYDRDATAKAMRENGAGDDI